MLYVNYAAFYMKQVLASIVNSGNWRWIVETAEESPRRQDSNPQYLDLESGAIPLDHYSLQVYI
jgi:hypothetical protein